MKIRDLIGEFFIWLGQLISSKKENEIINTSVEQFNQQEENPVEEKPQVEQKIEKPQEKKPETKLEPAKIELIVDDFMRMHTYRYKGENVIEQLAALKDLNGDDANIYSAINLFLSKAQTITVDDLFSLAGFKKLSIVLPEGKVECNTMLPADIQKWQKVIGVVGLPSVIHLFEDKNFVGVSSWSMLANILAPLYYDTSYFQSLINYFSFGDGKKYLADPTAYEELNKIAQELSSDADKYQLDRDADFTKLISSLTEVYRAKGEKNSSEFFEFLGNVDDYTLEVYFSYARLEDDYCENTDYCEEWGLFYENQEVFKKYIQYVHCIYDDNLFLFLMINNSLPERHKQDGRYDESDIAEADKAVKEFDHEKFANAIWPKEDSILKDFVLGGDDDDDNKKNDFLSYCINEEKALPVGFWKDMPEDKAQELLDADSDYTSSEYISYGYVLSGYKMLIRNVNEITSACLYASMRMYYQLHCK